MTVAKKTIRLVIEYALLGLPVAVYIDQNVASFAVVHGSSMAPTLNARVDMDRNAKRDVVLLDKWSGECEPGDIVAMHSPDDPRKDIIKRVSCSPPIDLPKGYVWVEGDNPSFSRDSRHFGPVPQALIFGIARAAIYPTPRQLDLSQNH